MKRFILILALCLLCPSYALAVITGNELVGFAFSSSAYMEGIFSGYVEGVIEARFREVCVPNGVIRKQANDIVMKYLLNNPAELHQPADDIVIRAVQQAWPCR